MCGRILRCLWIASWLGRLAEAQIFAFEQTLMPFNRSLHILYTYYIYSKDTAPDHSLGHPFIKFHDLLAKTDTPGSNNERSIQVTVMKYDTFWSAINPAQFCCGAREKSAGLCTEPNTFVLTPPAGKKLEDLNVHSHTIRFHEGPLDIRVPLFETGVYILVISNCGSINSGSITGSVVVKNPHGFLPGNEYHKLPFYGWLSIFYTMLAAFWMYLSVKWWRELSSIQNCISLVIGLGLIESFLWWCFFDDWNDSGTRATPLFFLSLIASVFKSIFSYMLVLVASLGWGVTRPYLDKRVTVRLQGISAAYILLDGSRMGILSFQHSHALSIPFVVFCLLPVSLLNGVIIAWVFTALTNLIATLKSRRQSDKELLFQRLFKMLASAIAVTCVSLLYHLFTLSRSVSDRWHSEWLFTDGIQHLVFLYILSGMIFLWAPSAFSKKFAYSQQLDGKDFRDEEEAEVAALTSGASGAIGAGKVWSKDEVIVEEGEEEDDDSFWASTHGKEDPLVSRAEEGAVPPPPATQDLEAISEGKTE